MGCCSSTTPTVWEDSRIVTTKYGKLQGKRLIDDTILKGPVGAYLGIPFAAPPVGQLRFKKSVPPSSWMGVREAKTFGPIAIQGEFFLKNKLRPKKSEDCLYLNVFAPTWKPGNSKISGGFCLISELSSGFPVMVFIHGGAFAVGNAFDYGDDNICRTLVAKDVIVVTIQYRIGFLGFWFTGDKYIPANLGLWDQTAALQWIQDNIEAFGGDKNNVTVSGESAGGISTDMLTLSPHSNHLFHKAIPMSCSAECRFGNPNVVMPIHCKTQAKRMKITWSSSEEMFEQLMAAPAKDFEFSMNYSSFTDEPNEVKKGPSDNFPVIDGDFFPESYTELRKKAPPKPFLAGVCKNEWLLFEILHAGFDHKTALQVNLEIAIPDDREDALARREKLRSEYIPKLGNMREKLIGKLNLCSDVLFNSALWKLLHEQVAANNGEAPVFAYVYCYNNPKLWGMLRFLAPFTEATHGSELAYLFGRPLLSKFKFNEEDKKIVDLMATSFTNFVKYGDTNGPKNAPTQLPIPWPRVTKENNERHVRLDTTMEVSDSLYDGRAARIAALRETK